MGFFSRTGTVSCPKRTRQRNSLPNQDRIDGSRSESRTMPAGRKLTSEELATLIIDALVGAGIVKEADAEQAIVLTAREIELRKVIGDY